MLRALAGVMAAVSVGAQSPHLLRFDRVVLLEATSETSANVHVGDVNGDGRLDIVLAKGRHWGLVDRVLLGDGRGSFPTAYDLVLHRTRPIRAIWLTSMRTPISMS